MDFSKLADRLGFRAKWSIEDGIREVHTALTAGIWKDPSDPRYYNFEHTLGDVNRLRPIERSQSGLARFESRGEPQ